MGCWDNLSVVCGVVGCGVHNTPYCCVGHHFVMCGDVGCVGTKFIQLLSEDELLYRGVLFLNTGMSDILEYDLSVSFKYDNMGL